MNRKSIVVTVVVAALSAMGAFAAGKAQASIIRSKPTELKWGNAVAALPVGQGPQAAILWGDPVKGPVGFFLKVPGGNNSGVHMHDSDYRGVVVQGTLTDSETDDPAADSLPTGSYYFQPGKQFHNNVCRSKEDCIVYIEFTQGGLSFIPKDKPTAKN